MAFLKIKTMYVIGNANGECTPPFNSSSRLPQQQLTHLSLSKATTVDLIIFGTAEPATAIMAASIPMLRVLVQRAPSSKPSQFVELESPRKTESAIVSSVPGPDSVYVIDKERTAEDSWPEVVAVEHAARGRRQSDKGREEDHGWAA